MTDKSYKMDHRNGGVENTGFSNSTDDPDGNLRQPNGQTGGPQNGSAVAQKDDIIAMVTETEEAKIKMLPAEMQDKVRNKPPEMRAVLLDTALMKKFAIWPEKRKVKILEMAEGELKRFHKLSDEEREEFFNDLDLDEDLEKDAKNAGEAGGNEMQKKLQNLPPDMRQIFMNMSNEERQKFIEMTKKAAGWPPEKKQKMFKKVYQDHMKKQVRDIMKARRQQRKNMKTVGFFELFRFADGLDKLLMIIGTIGAMITGCGLPINVLFYGQVANEFISEELAEENNDTTGNINVYDEVMSVVPYFIIVGVVVLIAAFIGMTCWCMTAERQARRIRSMLFHNIMRQHVGWFDLHQSGQLNVRLSDDIMKIQMGMGDKIFTFIQWMTAFIAGYTVGFVQGWVLTLVILAVAPLMVVAVAMVAVVTQRFVIFEQLAYARAGAVAEEVLSSIRTVAAFGGQEKECHRYNSRLDGAKQVGIKRGLFHGIGSGVVWLVIFGAYSLAFWYGTQLVINEGYEPGDILQVFMGVLIGTTSLGQCLPNMEHISTARGAAASVYDIIDLESEIDSTSDEGSKPEVIGNVTFEDVHFTYPARKDVKVMHGLSLKVKVGSTVALVGPSGCGKSTTVQLLQRFYDPQYGKIFVDGHDIKEMNVKWLRQNVGVVSQEPVLFATTIAENIRYGQEGVTMEEIETAARNANAYDFINKLPKKFNTLVGERGAQLSGGQKQRIAIARALVRNPKILLLDEATSALDTESESIVQQALERASKGRTTIVIAHRLSTIKNADVIVGILDGQVQEMGSHEKLMEKEGIYYHLVMSQTAAEHSEESIFLDITDDELDDPKAIKRTVSFDGESLRRSFRRSLRKQSKYKQQSSVVSSASTAMSEDEEEEQPPPPFRRLLKMNSPEWRYITAGCTAAMLTGALQPCFAIIFAEIMGNFAEPDKGKMESNSEFYALLLAGLGVCVGVANLVMSYTMGHAGENLTLRLRQWTFAAMLRQEIGWFDDKRNQVGALTSRLATDASLVRQATGQQLATLIQSFFTMITSLLIAFIFGWKLACVVVAFLPLIVLSTMFQRRMSKDALKGNRMAVAGGGKISAEAVENIRTVAALNREETFERNFNSYFDDAYQKGVRKAYVFGGSYAFSAAVGFFCYAATFSYGAELVQNGEMEFPDVFRIFAAVTFGGAALGRASALTPDIGRAKVAAANVLRLLDRKPPIDSSSKEGLKPEKFSGEVKFEGVQFRYPSRPDVKVLQGLDIEVKPGQSLALVGSSGCGKSTTVQLIERFYDLAGGSVYFDRFDQSKLNINWLRSQLGLVQQEPVLFGSSIRDNIAYGDNSRIVPMDEIIQAARNANIHNFIDSLPQGYDTSVGDKGTQLSGGQKQRIAIARALIRNPKVLLLDEATSALDTESERIVQEALDRASEGRTCIIIAHRLSTIQNADIICVIHNGQVVELGRHHQLMEQKGYYYRLQQAQNRVKNS